MEDFEAPSFSLGFDFDLDTDLQPSKQSPPPEPSLAPPPPPQTFENTEPFEPQTLDAADLRVEDSPPALKRLKRGLRNHSSSRPKVSFCADDEIEELSSQENPIRDEHSVLQNTSLCSISKLPMQSSSTPTAQFRAKLKAPECAPSSNASTITKMESGSNKLMFPKLTTSPLRRFLLVDSDSDETSFSEDLYEDKTRVDASIRQSSSNHSMVKNLQKREKASSTTFQTKDLWKDFTPKTSGNIPTPALDEICEEYFSSMKDKNVGKSKEDDMCISSSKSCYQKSNISENIQLHGNRPNTVLPAYKYFYHNDPKIQRLVRDRLPNFFPLDDVNVGGNHQSVVDIDYMYQFGQRDLPSAAQGPEGSSKRGRKSHKQSNASELSQASGGWMNPKSSTAIPKNAGKRRVSAGGSSAGSWFTGEGGRKVFVTQTGQELTGRAAYRHYKKANGGFKKSKRKGASKKGAPKKKAKR